MTHLEPLTPYSGRITHAASPYIQISKVHTARIQGKDLDLSGHHGSYELFPRAFAFPDEALAFPGTWQFSRRHFRAGSLQGIVLGSYRVEAIWPAVSKG